MSIRAGTGWQTSLADLSLILFMVMASVVSRQPAKLAAHPAAMPKMAPVALPRGAQRADAPSPQTEPLSVYIAAPGAPPLDEWLHEQAADPRQQLTITARYDSADAAGQARALADAQRLLERAGALGHAARLVVEPGSAPPRAALAYDVPGGTDASN